MILVMTLISMLCISVNASALGDILAVFSFLPAPQFNQLKPKIIQILYQRPPSSQPIYKQAKSIVSEISAAYSMVVSHGQVLPKTRLMKRSQNITVSGPIHDDANTDPYHLRESFDIPESFKDIPELVQKYGFMDIFSLTDDEISYLHQIMAGMDSTGTFHFLNNNLEKCANYIRKIIRERLDGILFL